MSPTLPSGMQAQADPADAGAKAIPRPSGISFVYKPSGRLAARLGWPSFLEARPGLSTAPAADTDTGSIPRTTRRDILGEWNAVVRGNFAMVGIFSVFVNLLMLTVPIYLFQLSDRVLSSRSLDTLVMLSILALAFLAVLALLDTLRRQILVRTSIQLEAIFGGPVLAGLVATAPATGGGSVNALRNLHQVRSFISGPVMLMLFDAPMAPLYFVPCS